MSPPSPIASSCVSAIRDVTTSITRAYNIATRVPKILRTYNFRSLTFQQSSVAQLCCYRAEVLYFPMAWRRYAGRNLDFQQSTIVQS